MPVWSDAITWVLGLPVAVLAVIGTIYQVPKFRGEQRKLSLEIERLERERALEQVQETTSPAEVARIVAAPIFENRRDLELVLRFVLFYLLIQAWSIVASLFGVAINGARLGLEAALESASSVANIALFIVLQLIASIPTIVRSVLFAAVGWPLLLDVATTLRFKLPAFFYSPWTKRALIFIAVAIGISQNLTPGLLSSF